jgi:hypothetical protein
MNELLERIKEWYRQLRMIGRYPHEEKLMRDIEKALTPPTEQEVCEALSEYLDTECRYDNVAFQRLDGCWFEYIDINDLTVSAPHLITLIGRFYEAHNEQ